MPPRDEVGLDGVLARATAIGLPESTRDNIARCSEFHTYPAPGLVIGAFMVERALAELGATPNEKLFAVSETKKCLPDALQVIAHCTIGNNRLRVLHAGRFAITLNRPSLDPAVEGVRIYLDETRLSELPTLYAWFTHDRSFDRHTMTGRLFDEILQGAGDYLASERVAVRVTQKEGWQAGRCDCCGELVPDTLLHDGACAFCRDEQYYAPL